jgi:carboxypeptidase PM20D1
MNAIDIIFTGLLLLLLTLCILLVIAIIKTLLCKNKEIKVLKMSKIHESKTDEYAGKLFELVNIKTTSYENGETYHIYREKVKELFPLLHQYFTKEKIGGNAIMNYRSDTPNAQKLLFVTHIDTPRIYGDAKVSENEIYGPGTFDSKALFFVIFQAIEEHLLKYKKFDFDITVVMTVDDISTKEGNEKIVNKFLKQGSFFKLVIEEGIGIIDPTFLGMKSHYALVGIGVTGEVKIRYKVKKDLGQVRLDKFLEDLTSSNPFKSQIDKNAVKVLGTLAKDMPFVNRLLFSNIWLFRPFVKKIIDNDQTEISKLLKTHIIYSKIEENESYYYVDLTFELATHDTAAEIVGIVAPYVKTHGIEYDLKSVKDPSKVTSLNLSGYEIVKDAIDKTYKHLYVAPYIITKIAEQRYLSRVSDCVIRFSPLYYPYQALQDASKGDEHIMKKSLNYGVDFYKEIFNRYMVD